VRPSPLSFLTLSPPPRYPHVRYVTGAGTAVFARRSELWGVDFPGTAARPGYMQLYNASARAIKAVHSTLRVGGPATAGLADLPAFVKACTSMGLPAPDFVSSHHYPSDGKSGPTRAPPLPPLHDPHTQCSLSPWR
jgi:hypothetical protein